MKQRLALYHGVMPLYMEFTDDVEETFSQALNLLLVTNDHYRMFLMCYVICFLMYTESYLCLFSISSTEQGSCD